MLIKLVGGPMHGQTVEVDDDVEVFKVGRFWRYTWTNSKEGDRVLFALASASRPVQRAVRWFIEKWGQHPAMNPKEQPYVKRRHTGRNDPCPCKSGRKAKRCCGVD